MFIRMNEDPLLWLTGDDDEMNAAIKKAQDTFPEIVRELDLEARRVVPGLDAAIVKAFFFDDDAHEQGEHMFVEQVRLEGETVHGVLASTPQVVTSVKEGEDVSFPASRISDWFIVIEGRGKGGFTLDVIGKRMSPSEYREASKYPPFSWFA